MNLSKIGVVIIIIFFLVSIFAPLIAPYDPVEQKQFESHLSTEERLI